MKKILWIALVTLSLSACDNAMDAGHKTAREVTGANMIDQGKQVQQQLHDIDRQQQQRFEQMDQQLNDQ